MAVTEPNKLVMCGSFAECYTRQKSYLPSAMKNTLGKANTWQKSVHSGAKMAYLPSACAVTLPEHSAKRSKAGSEMTSLYRVSGSGHSTNMHYLSSVRAKALDKQGHVCRVPRPLDTRQTRRDRFRAITLFFFVERWFQHSATSLPSIR